MAHTQNPKHNVIIKTAYMVGTMVQVTESCRSIYIYIEPETAFVLRPEKETERTIP